MLLTHLAVENFLGVCGEIQITLYPFTVLVGRNDVGKSTILKALDFFFNDMSLSEDHLNRRSTSSAVAVECWFDPNGISVVIDDEVETRFEDEELVDENGRVRVRKTWDLSGGRAKAEYKIYRKKYDSDDFLMCNQTELMNLCRQRDITTSRANGPEFNNAEKRRKLRQAYREEDANFIYEYTKLNTTGQGRPKAVYDGLKRVLPPFEYFRADSSLAETDKVIQDYIKREVQAIIDDCDKSEMERCVKDHLGSILGRLTTKINRTVSDEEQVEPKIDFDWSKIVKTSFHTQKDDIDVPLSQRGDGFRRITMMSFFEHLAEERRAESIIFAFEEPETFLHPSAQEQLFETLHDLPNAGHQIVLCTHSPILVANAPCDSLIHVRREEGKVAVEQNLDNYQKIADDLGISMRNQFVSMFDNAKVLLLVEGIDDAKAFNHTCDIYKASGEIDHTFSELHVAIIPMGGVNSIEHWITLDLLNQLSKPFIIWLDSDRSEENGPSPTLKSMEALPFELGSNLFVSYKRSLENYIPARCLQSWARLSVSIEYDGWTHVKNLVRAWPDGEEQARLGGKRVADRHFTKLRFEDLKESYKMPNGQDEFLVLYEAVTAKLNGML